MRMSRRVCGTLSLPPLVAGFFADSRGATAIEYAIIASLLSLVVIAAVAALGGGVDVMFNYVARHALPALTLD